jgi:hypothetical protein
VRELGREAQARAYEDAAQAPPQSRRGRAAVGPERGDVLSDEDGLELVVANPHSLLLKYLEVEILSRR